MPGSDSTGRVVEIGDLVLLVEVAIPATFPARCSDRKIVPLETRSGRIQATVHYLPGKEGTA